MQMVLKFQTCKTFSTQETSISYPHSINSLHIHISLNLPNKNTILYTILSLINRKSICRILVIHITSLREIAKLFTALRNEVHKVCTGARLAWSIDTANKGLGGRVNEDTIEFTDLVVIFVAVAVAAHLLDGNVCQELQEVGALPGAAVVDGVSGHGGVDVICTGESAVVEESEGNEDSGWEFAVGEGDLEVLGSGVAASQELVDGRVDPWESNGAGYFVAIARVVVVHDVVGILEGEPLVGREEGKRTERR